MNLTPGERRALPFLVPVIVSFLPPVTTWVADIHVRVLGLPFIVFWSALSVAMTAVWVTLALYVKDRTDGQTGS